MSATPIARSSAASPGLRLPAPAGAARASPTARVDQHVAGLARIARRAQHRPPADDQPGTDPDLPGDEHEVVAARVRRRAGAPRARRGPPRWPRAPTGGPGPGRRPASRRTAPPSTAGWGRGGRSRPSDGSGPARPRRRPPPPPAAGPASVTRRSRPPGVRRPRARSRAAAGSCGPGRRRGHPSPMVATVTDSTPSSTARTTAPSGRTWTIGDGRPGPACEATPCSKTRPRCLEVLHQLGDRRPVEADAAPRLDREAEPWTWRWPRRDARFWRRTPAPVCTPAALRPSGRGLAGCRVVSRMAPSSPATPSGSTNGRDDPLTASDARHYSRPNLFWSQQTRHPSPPSPEDPSTALPRPRSGRRRLGAHAGRHHVDPDPGRRPRRRRPTRRRLQGPRRRQDAGLPALAHRRHHQRRHRSSAAARLHRRRVGPAHSRSPASRPSPWPAPRSRAPRTSTSTPTILFASNVDGTNNQDPARPRTLDDSELAALQGYMRDGGGFVGLHAATDAMHAVPWYGELTGGGARFRNHPAQQTATMRVESPTHPSTEMLPKEWIRFDEWYNFTANPREDVHVLLTLDESTYSGGGRWARTTPSRGATTSRAAVPGTRAPATSTPPTPTRCSSTTCSVGSSGPPASSRAAATASPSPRSTGINEDARAGLGP